MQTKKAMQLLEQHIKNNFSNYEIDMYDDVEQRIYFYAFVKGAVYEMQARMVEEWHEPEFSIQVEIRAGEDWLDYHSAPVII